jgi:hypothetical protein
MRCHWQPVTRSLTKLARSALPFDFSRYRLVAKGEEQSLPQPLEVDLIAKHSIHRQSTSLIAD